MDIEIKEGEWPQYNWRKRKTLVPLTTENGVFEEISTLFSETNNAYDLFEKLKKSNYKNHEIFGNGELYQGKFGEDNLEIRVRNENDEEIIIQIKNDTNDEYMNFQANSERLTLQRNKGGEAFEDIYIKKNPEGKFSAYFLKDEINGKNGCKNDFRDLTEEEMLEKMKELGGERLDYFFKRIKGFLDKSIETEAPVSNEVEVVKTKIEKTV